MAEGHIRLVDAIGALRGELADAVAAAQGEEMQFTIRDLELELRVGVTRAKEGRAALNFWLLELGGGGSFSTEAVQTVRLRLEGPVDSGGRPVKVGRQHRSEPESAGAGG